MPKISGNGMLSSESTVPLLADRPKAAALQRFWNGGGAIVLWHPQKTGGTTFCQIAIKVGLYSPRFWMYAADHGEDRAVTAERIERSNCRFGYVDTELCESAGVLPEDCKSEALPLWPVQAAIGRHIFTMEPAFLLDDAEPILQKWSKMVWFQSPSSEEWMRWVHVVTIRDPAERFYSDFRMKMFDEKCSSIRVPLEECIERMLSPETLDSLQQEWLDTGLPWLASTPLTMIKERLLVNYLIIHLSGTADNVTIAKDNLRRMSAIIDFEARPAESYFILKQLYQPFVGSNFSMEAISGRHDQSVVHLRELSPGLYAKVRSYFRADFELYEYGLSLLDSHAKALNFKPG